MPSMMQQLNLTNFVAGFEAFGKFGSYQQVLKGKSNLVVIADLHK